MPNLTNGKKIGIIAGSTGIGLTILGVIAYFLGGKKKNVECIEDSECSESEATDTTFEEVEE